jgi:uncharacterized Zn finger protein
MDTTKCRSCHRVLRSASSIAAGIGPTCARNEKRKQAAAELIVQQYTHQQVKKAAALLTAGSVTQIDLHTFQAVSASGARYDVDTTRAACTCPAGQHGRACYHLAAAQLLAA